MVKYTIYTIENIRKMNTETLHGAVIRARSNFHNYRNVTLQRIGSYDIREELMLQYNWLNLRKEQRRRELHKYEKFNGKC